MIREFVVTCEMKSDANSDRREMMRLRDEMERNGFRFKSEDSFDLAGPHEIAVRQDGTTIFRQFTYQ